MVDTYTAVLPGSDSRLGGSATQRDLLLKRFAGEVLATYHRQTVMGSRLWVKDAKNSKSVQFPAIGKVTASYHQPGEELSGQTVKHGERVVTIDDLLVSDVFVSNFLEAMTHFDTRSVYASEMGDALAQAYDRKAFALAINAALDPTNALYRPAIDEMDQASTITLTGNPLPSASDFVGAVYEAESLFAEKNVPNMDRVLITTPRMKNKLIEAGEMLNQDFGNGGNGSQASAMLKQVAGLPVVVSNNLQIDNQGAVTREGTTDTKYNVDASGTSGADTNAVGLVIQRQAIGVAELMGVSVEEDYQIERQGSLMVAKRANGMGIVRPEGITLIEAAVAA